jgi:sigma-E factor negative regulatory protein RseC
MITENGVVSKANGSEAWIKTTRYGACESCSSKNSCGSAGNHKEMIVKVPNSLNVEKGDQVVIGLETGPILYLTFLLYVFPIILMIIGALIGHQLGSAVNMNPSIPSMILGFGSFGLTFYILRKKNRSMEGNQKYKPFLIRKITHIQPQGCTLS